MFVSTTSNTKTAFLLIKLAIKNMFWSEPGEPSLLSLCVHQKSATPPQCYPKKMKWDSSHSQIRALEGADGISSSPRAWNQGMLSTELSSCPLEEHHQPSAVPWPGHVPQLGAFNFQIPIPIWQCTDSIIQVLQGKIRSAINSRLIKDFFW